MELASPERFFCERFGLSGAGLERVLGAALAARPSPHDLYPVARPPIDTPVTDQIALLARVDAAARAVDPCITNVFAGLGVEHRVVLIVTSAGTIVGDVRPLLHLSVTCIA